MKLSKQELIKFPVLYVNHCLYLYMTNKKEFYDHYLYIIGKRERIHQEEHYPNQRIVSYYITKQTIEVSRLYKTNKQVSTKDWCLFVHIFYKLQIYSDRKLRNCTLNAINNELQKRKKNNQDTTLFDKFLCNFNHCIA